MGVTKQDVHQAQMAEQAALEDAAKWREKAMEAEKQAKAERVARASAEAEAGRLRKAMAQAEAKVEHATSNADTMASKLSAARGEAAQAKFDADAARKDAHRHERRANALASNLEDLKTKRADEAHQARTKAKRAAEELAAERQRANDATERAAYFERALEKTIAERNAALAAKHKAGNDLDSVNKRAAVERTESSERIAAVESEIKAAKREAAHHKGQATKAKDAKDHAEAKVKSLTSRLSKAQSETQDWRARFEVAEREIAKVKAQAKQPAVSAPEPRQVQVPLKSDRVRIAELEAEVDRLKREWG